MMNEWCSKVFAGDLLMCCLMRVDYTVWLSPSLRASHDNRVSVTPFNPITPTWSDTNGMTPFLLSARPSPFPWFPDTHSVTSGGGVYSSISCKSGCTSPPLIFCLLLKPSLSFIPPLSLFCLLAQQEKKIQPLITKVKAVPQASVHSPEH